MASWKAPGSMAPKTFPPVLPPVIFPILVEPKHQKKVKNLPKSCRVPARLPRIAKLPYPRGVGLRLLDMGGGGDPPTGVFNGIHVRVTCHSGNGERKLRLQARGLPWNSRLGDLSFRKGRAQKHVRLKMCRPNCWWSKVRRLTSKALF